jgi:aerobic C4-dicarboxylate transport protein
VATVVVGKWTGDLDLARLTAQLNSESPADAEEPEKVLDAREEQMPAQARS